MIHIFSEEYLEYLKSPRWQFLRSERLKIDNYRCQRCASPLNLDVHHTKYPKELGTENVHNDLITLCRRCHEYVEEQKLGYRREQEERLEEIRARNEEMQRQYQEEQDLRKRLMHQFLDEYGGNDLSNVGVGKDDYCNLSVLKADYNSFMREHGAKAYEDGSFAGVGKMQQIFRNRRYKIILSMLEKNYPIDIIEAQTMFSQNMIKKVANDPRKYTKIIESEGTEL